jgi:hypothetical protein
MGGVTGRFPQLTFGLLECGVAWACELLASLVEHWEGRNVDVMDARARVFDLDEWRRYREQWGGSIAMGKTDDTWLAEIAYGWPDSPPDTRDEWHHMRIADEHEFLDRFVPNLYFGCESSDRTVAFAFSTANAFGAELKPVLSSDIGHWDVNDMSEVLPKAYGLVEEGVLTPEQFRKFTFDNPVALHRRMNPEFFRGTRVETAVDQLRHAAISNPVDLKPGNDTTAE